MDEVPWNLSGTSAVWEAPQVPNDSIFEKDMSMFRVYSSGSVTAGLKTETAKIGSKTPEKRGDSRGTSRSQQLAGPSGVLFRCNRACPHRRNRLPSRRAQGVLSGLD